ncbi:dentin sialophosphoprotein-like [Harpegnathos saltator]|uniref:dentin sialophosphoprotein-like n=1 Tax=Harpegnathos saltator TaxID=610380 RepID=UPI000DBED89C|nr:dentin sialophosphoprotein-like [Harpegnathos saltator]
MPEKREKKDEKKKKKDKGEKKEPVIRTERESVDSSESRAAIAAGDNPPGDPDAAAAAAFRYEWGVKLAEEEPAAAAAAAEASDNDNLAEKGRRYVTKRLWGVYLTHPKPDVEGAAAPLMSEGAGSGAYQRRNASRFSGNDDTAAQAGGAEGQLSPKGASAKRRDEQSSSRGAKDDEGLSTWFKRDSPSGDFHMAQREAADATSSPTSSRALRSIMKESPGGSSVALGDGYNVPPEEQAAQDVEIDAWRSLAVKSRSAMRAILSNARPQRLETRSIRPEAPQPKLDVRVVRSSADETTEVKDEQTAGYKLSSMGLKRMGHADAPNQDQYPLSKKLHTASAQVHRTLLDARTNDDATWRRVGSLPPADSIAVDGTARTKNPGIATASPASSEGPEEKMSDKLLNRQEEQHDRQSDLKNLDDEKPTSRDTSDSIKSTEQILSPAESQTSSSDREQPDVGIDVIELPSTVEDEEVETSTSQPQDGDRQDAEGASDSTNLKDLEDERSRAEEESVRDETELHERGSHKDSRSKDNRMDSSDETRDSSSADYDVTTIDDDPTKSPEAAAAAASMLAVSAKNTVRDSNTEDSTGDDLGGGQYVTDGDYVRLHGDPYPYSKENLDRWRMLAQSRSRLYKPLKRQASSPTLVPDPPFDRVTPRNANDAYANGAGRSYGSHGDGTITETSGSGDGATDAKNVGLASGFRAASRDQRVVAPDCDAADALGLRRWTEAFSRLGDAVVAGAATAGGETSEAERGDNASLRAYHQ